MIQASTAARAATPPPASAPRPGRAAPACRPPRPACRGRTGPRAPPARPAPCRPACSALTSPAEHGGAAGQADDGQRAAAAQARLAAPAVDLEQLLLVPHLAPGVAVGVDRAAAVGDRLVEQLGQRAVQAADGLAAEA